MRRMTWVLVLAAVTPLLAGGAALGQPDFEYPPPKDYAYRNGKVFIGGDVVVPCRVASEYGPTDDDTREARAQFERAMERCEQAEPGALPDTGGAPAPLLAAGVVLLCVGFTAIHRTS